MQELLNFLTFKSFISNYMLFIFYYVGAILVPYIGFIYAKKLYDYPKETLDAIVPREYKIKILLISMGIFIFLEILWRMMFEFLLAFLQIRDALVA